MALFGWKSKAAVLALASRAPGGKAVYRRLQDLQASRMRDAETLLARGLDLLQLHREGGGNLRGKSIIEVGTGWCPWVPLLARLSGAARIVTIDVNPWLSHRTAVATTQAILERGERISSALDISIEHLAAQLEPAVRTNRLDDWLRHLAIEYRSEVAVQDALLEDGAYHAVMSSNVLEHVPPLGLAEIHNESFRVLRPGGLVVHRFNPEDHFSHSDASITGANFLRFTEAEWNWLGGSGLAYHNRLRCRQHMDLVREAGFNIVHSRTRANVAARIAIESGALPVDSAFAGMDPIELSDDYMWMVAQKPRNA